MHGAYIMCVTICIYRALEDKKEAFAKAEIERRKEALELRRKGQQEATLRFRNVIRKPPVKPPEKKTITYPTKGTGLHNFNIHNLMSFAYSDPQCSTKDSSHSHFTTPYCSTTKSSVWT